MTRLLVCGSREWEDREYLNRILDAYHAFARVAVLIEGEARGADRMAADWGYANHVLVERYPARWGEHGRSAGPIRNRQMLREGRPDVVIAFHRDIASSKGTRDMVTVAGAAGLPVYIVPFEGVRPPWSPLP